VAARSTLALGAMLVLIFLLPSQKKKGCSERPAERLARNGGLEAGGWHGARVLCQVRLCSLGSASSLRPGGTAEQVPGCPRRGRTSAAAPRCCSCRAEHRGCAQALRSSGPSPASPAWDPRGPAPKAVASGRTLTRSGCAAEAGDMFAAFPSWH